MAGNSGDPCVSLDVLKLHLRVTVDDEDDLIQLYLETAQHIVIDRLERATTDTVLLADFESWDEDTTPAGVKAAVLWQAAELYRYRGDDEHTPVTADGRLSLRVESCLAPWLERAFS